VAARDRACRRRGLAAGLIASLRPTQGVNNAMEAVASITAIKLRCATFVERRALSVLTRICLRDATIDTLPIADDHGK